jgi:hypothetical protein
MKLQLHFLKESTAISSTITTMRFKEMSKQLSSLTGPVVRVKEWTEGYTLQENAAKVTGILPYLKNFR